MIEQWNAVVSCDFCGNTEEFEFHGHRPPDDFNLRHDMENEGWKLEMDNQWKCPDCVTDDEPEDDDE